MFCTFCGTENPDYAKFCRKCGAAIDLSPASALPAPSTANLDLATLSALDGTQHGESEVAELASASSPSRSYADQYRRLTNDELVHLDSERDSLTPEAAHCLQEEIQTRQLDLTRLATPVQSQVCTDTPTGTASRPMILYATLTQRFLAYFADVVVVYLIVILAYFASGVLRVFGKTSVLSEDASEFQLVYIIALCFYMTLALRLYHTTIGKYALELEVAAEKPVGAYPSFWRILFRETLGRFLSSLFFGIGYWSVSGHEKKQAWSDAMAGTVVQIRKVNRTLKNAFSAFVIIGLVVDAGAIIYGLQVEEHRKNHEAWEKELTSESSAVKDARSVTSSIIDREPRSFLDWQENMGKLLPALDNYDRELEAYKLLLERGRQQNLFDSDAERHQIEVLLQVFDYRQQQSAKQRQEANLVLQYDPSVSNFDELRSALRLLDSDIEALDRKASELLAQIGIK
jgi:RDD family/zinc-ribbon domain